MKTNLIRTGLLAALLLLLAWPAAMQAQLTFTTNNGAITITGYTGNPTSVVIPSTTNGYPVANIGNYAFNSCTSLTYIFIPNSVTNIGIGAFENCNGLTNINLGTSLTTIGDAVFFGCSELTSIAIPSSVTSIGQQVFWNTLLTNITVSANNPKYSSLNGVLFDKNQTMLIIFPPGITGSYVIPNGVTNIGGETNIGMGFSLCSLASVSIPNSVTSIGSDAFESCLALTNVTMGTNITRIGDSAFAGCAALPSISFPNSVTTIGLGAFYGCFALTNVTMGTNITSIGDSAFLYCSALPSISIPNSVTNIGNFAFFDCMGLTNVTIGRGVIYIGDLVFFSNNSLQSIYFLGNAPTVAGDAFVGYLNLGSTDPMNPSSSTAWTLNATAYYLAGTTGWGSTLGGGDNIYVNDFNNSANSFYTTLSGLTTVMTTNTPNPPVFLFSTNNYYVNENNGTVVVTVLNNGDLGGLVNYTTANGTAFGGSGYSGSYTIAQGSFTFASGQHATNLAIGILDNYLDAPDINFTVQLFNPSAGMLGNPATATITIHQNDIGGVTNSLLTTVSPTTQPATSGALTVYLTPTNASGQWRFPWEQGWHDSGYTATSLQAGNYQVNFQDVSNYLAYPSTLTVAVTNNGTTLLTNQYLPGYTALDTNGTGSLTVNIKPNAPPGSGWRFIGETGWRSPNTSAAGLLPDTYFIQFEPVTGWASPASRAVVVYSGQGTVVPANYLLAAAFPPGVSSTPSQVSPSLITDAKDFPYAFNGQLNTDVGYGSGVAVRQSVVLTAAHMVFNDATLSYVNQAYWSFQQEVGSFVPEPLPARGWYVLSGYASQRTNDLTTGGYGVDASSSASRDLDVAALYFLNPVARGGYGGYLSSDATPNPWLTGSSLKMLVGYPVDGTQYGQVVTPGTMYVTGPQTTALNQDTDQVYSASWFLSYPGNSGGPLYVSFNGYYYPAGVYLGEDNAGKAKIRAINSDVVNLINLAATEGDAGTNHAGGGVLTLIAGALSAANPAYVQVVLSPPAAVAAGAGWRLTGDSAYGTATNYTRVITTNGASLQFKPVSGWNTPTNQTVRLSAGTVNIVTNVAYTVVPPVMVADGNNGIGFKGTAGTTYAIQFCTNLASGKWVNIKTNTLGTGTNYPFAWPPTNGPAGYYRALWLP